MADLTCIKTFAHQFEAELAARTLEANGVQAHLSSENLRGEIPASFATGGVRLFVDDSDADRAVAILTAPQSAQSHEPEDGASGSGASDGTALVAARPRPSKRLVSGALWLAGGVAVTAATYVLAPGGWFVLAWGAVVYGLYQIIGGIRDAWAAAEAAQENGSRGDDEGP